MNVIGIGEKKTPQPFIVACDRFIYIEILGGNKEKRSKNKQPQEKRKTQNQFEKITPLVIELIQSTVDDTADEDGWAFLGDVGSLIQKKQPNFDSRNFGFDKLTPLIEATKVFDIEKRDSQKSKLKLIFIRNKE